MCWPWDMKCHAETIASGFLGDIQKATNEATTNVVQGLSTFWMKVPSPNLGTVNGTSFQANTVVDFLSVHTAYYAGALAIISVLITAGRMAWLSRGKGEALREGLASLLKLAVVSGAGLAATTLLLQAGDSFSTWVIDEAVGNGQDFGGAMNALMQSGGTAGAIIAIVSGIIAVIAGMIQVALMVARIGLSYVLGGTLVMAWSATNTSWGKNWASKQTGWLIALVLYKPAASLIYAAAFKTTAAGFTGQLGDSNGTRWINMVVGLILIFMAIVALPAMMKFIVPAVGAMGGGGAGMFMGAAAGAAASGAINAGRSGAGKGSGSASPGPGGSGGGDASGAVNAGSTGTKAAGSAAEMASKSNPYTAAAVEGGKAVKAGVDKAASATASETASGAGEASNNGATGTTDPAATSNGSAETDSVSKNEPSGAGDASNESSPATPDPAASGGSGTTGGGNGANGSGSVSGGSSGGLGGARGGTSASTGSRGAGSSAQSGTTAPTDPGAGGSGSGASRGSGNTGAGATSGSQTQTPTPSGQGGSRPASRGVGPANPPSGNGTVTRSSSGSRVNGGSTRQAPGNKWSAAVDGAARGANAGRRTENQMNDIPEGDGPSGNG